MVAALVGTVIWNILSSKFSQTLDIKVELTNASIVNKKPSSSGYSRVVEINLVMTNNSSETIGLDPNHCDDETFINGQKFEYTRICTQMGGIRPLIKPGKKSELRVISYAPNSKVGDSVYVVYGYNVITGIKDPMYDDNDSKYVQSNTIIIK